MATSLLSLKVLSRFQLSGNPSGQLPQPIDVHVLPGGNWLVAFAVLDARGGPKSTRVSLWDFRDTASPRCVVDLHIEGMDYPSTAAELDQERGIARLVLGYSPSEHPNKLEAYDIPLNREPTRPEAYQVSIPKHPSQGQLTQVTNVAISGDILSCIVQDSSQLDAFIENPQHQLKPLVPPAGVDQVHLVHRPTNTTRWLHPRHTSALNSAHVLFDDGYLYLLGRTPATYILRRYHFAPTMLIECTDDTFLDLGEPLAEYESPPLPDPGIPWGSCDFQNVHLEPSSHLSVLMLRSWYGEGQYLRFPLSSGTQPTVIRLEPDTHLPSNANFSPRWMGREQAMIFSDDDDDLDKNVLFRLSFPHSDSKDVAKDRSPSEASTDVIATGRVRREDLLTRAAESLLAKETRVLTRASVISVDEQSGRVCVLLMNGEGLILSSA